MADLQPFRALRPDPALAPRICELPYDVMSSSEARAIAQDNPLSFLHVSKPEIDLDPTVDIHSPAVYQKGQENFARLIKQGALRQDERPCYYFYRQVMGGHSQTGLVAVASCQDYLQNRIKKHELTRPDKEDDRVRHIETLNSQTGPVFLTYRANAVVDDIARRITTQPSAVDFTAADGVRHTAWVVADDATVAVLGKAFAATNPLYIADGHHRSAAAARVFQSRRGAGDSSHFLAVVFPHNQVQILPYNRVLKDLSGYTPEQVLQKLDGVFIITDQQGPPTRKHELNFYMGGKWRRLNFRPHFVRATDPIETLDVTLLQQYVLMPLFKIDDPRTSTRVNFVGGIRGEPELERLVDSGEYAAAFSMFPTSIEDLIRIADAGGIMPPKSTWFEPKLRDAMFCHLI